MTAAAEATKPETDTAAPALVVFGRDDAGKPHASAFSQADASLAEKAAGLMGMRALCVASDEARELAGKLPRGRVFASGRAFVPFVKARLYDALVGLADAAYGPAATATDSRPERPTRAGEAQSDSALAASNDGPPPPSWEAITRESVVLAPAAPGEGWWEAVVVKVTGDLLTLKWRDYPGEPQIVRQRRHLALLHPGHSAA